MTSLTNLNSKRDCTMNLNDALLTKIAQKIRRGPVFIKKTSLDDELGDVRQIVKVMNLLEKGKGSNTRYFTYRRGRGHRHGVKDWGSYLPLNKAEYVSVYVNRRTLYDNSRTV